MSRVAKRTRKGLKIALPRVEWSRKPETQIKGSDKSYDRKKEKDRLRKEWD